MTTHIEPTQDQATQELPQGKLRLQFRFYLCHAHEHNKVIPRIFLSCPFHPAPGSHSEGAHAVEDAPPQRALEQLTLENEIPPSSQPKVPRRQKGKTTQPDHLPKKRGRPKKTGTQSSIKEGGD